METKSLPIVCVIGGGISGLCAIRHLSKVAEVTCYEMKEDVGGLWNYSDENSWTKNPDNDLFFAKNGVGYDSMYDPL